MARIPEASYFQTPDWVLGWWETIGGKPPTELVLWRGPSGALEGIQFLSRLTRRVHPRLPPAWPFWTITESGHGSMWCDALGVPHCSCRTSIQERACRSCLQGLECCSGIHARESLCIRRMRSPRACGARSIIFVGTKREPTPQGSRFDGSWAVRWTTHSWNVSLNFTNRGWRKRACRVRSSRPRRFSVGSLRAVPPNGVQSQ